MITITPKPGTVRAKVRVNVRKGQPSAAAAKARSLDPGVRFPVLGVVLGQSVSGVAEWYACADDEFVWAGGCDAFEASVDAVGPDQGSEPDDDQDRPSRMQLGDYVPPRFELIAGIRHTVQGRRPNGLEGLIVHFDAYRIRRAGNGPEDSDSRSLDILRSGQENHFHYGEISRTGRVLLPENFDWAEWGSHAGVSLCPSTGRSGVSRYYVGFEMNNPGVLYPTADANVFCPWFNSERTATGAVKLDAEGRCTRRSANDEWYSRDQVRLAEGGNIHKHWYLPYSHEQFESLTNVVLYLAKRFPTTFSIDRVFGHDEVAPNRKDDPGGALANPDQVMTMAEFRAYLKSRF